MVVKSNGIVLKCNCSIDVFMKKLLKHDTNDLDISVSVGRMDIRDHIDKLNKLVEDREANFTTGIIYHDNDNITLSLGLDRYIPLTEIEDIATLVTKRLEDIDITR